MRLRYNSNTRRYSVEELTSGQLRKLLTEIKNSIMEKRRHFKIRAKERASGQIVTPEFIGYKTQAEVIEFFGLEEPDIEWYEIIEETPQKTIYLVDALSFTEAEARIIEEMKPYISGEFTVSAVGKTKISEIIGQIDEGIYYLAKVSYVTIDEKSGTEKRNVTQLLVGESDFQSAFGTLLQELGKSVSDWEIISITKTPILEVFPSYLSETK